MLEIAGQVKITGGTPGLNKVLTSDAAGLATWETPAASVTLGNPSATIGLTAVNGSGSVGMFANSAPALSQAIIPTWTGVHIFSGTPLGTNEAQVVIANATDDGSAAITFNEGGANAAKIHHEGAHNTGYLEIEDFSAAWSTTGLVIKQGNVGIGTTTPANKLDVEGGLAVGATYSGTSTAPTNGAIIEGNVGIGTTAPGYKLDVNGTTQASTYYVNHSNGNVLEIGNDAWIADVDLANAIGITGQSTASHGGIRLGSTAYIYSDGSANIGIGTTSPGQKLTIEGTAPIAEIRSGGYLMLRPTDNSWDMRLQTVGTRLDVLSGGSLGTPIASFVHGGNMGIGTTTPTKGKLEVNGYVNQNTGGSYGYLNTGGANGGAGASTVDVSIWASNRVIATEFNANSDARIKNINGISNSKNDLNTLMNIEITNYSLIDTIEKGNKNYKKVIAQQVEKVYPQVVNTLTDVVPDIYKLAVINNGRIAVTNNLKAGEKVKLIFENRTELVEVAAADKEGFNVNLIDKGKVFVYGREVADFHTVDYEGLTTLNISATQELVKQINDAQAKIDVLEKENTGVKSDVNTLKAELELIKEHLNMKTQK